MMPQVNRPIFLDPRGRRARLTNLFLLIVATLIVAGISVVATGVLISPEWQSVISQGEYGMQLPSAWSPSLSKRERPFSPARNRIVPHDTSSVLRLAFFTDDGAGAFPALKRHAAKLDGVIASWMLLVDRDGRAEIEKDDGIDPIRQWLGSNAPSVAVYPQMDSELSGGVLANILADRRKRSSLISEIQNFLGETQAQGIVVNFEEILDTSHRSLVIFLHELKAALGRQNQKLIFMAGAQGRGRLQEISRQVDYVVVRAHDRSLSETELGPLAGQGWFEEQLTSAIATLPANKLIISIGSFGYDFDPYGNKREISVQNAWDMLSRDGAEFHFDPKSLNPGLIYRNSVGQPHRVWYLDAITVFNQTRAALAAKPAGIAIWRLGLADPNLWLTLGKDAATTPAMIRSLAVMEPGHGSFFDAKGALLRATSGSTGIRRVSFNTNLGLIVNQRIDVPPLQANITRWQSHEPKQVALTFDDGPDPKYTGRILDVLAAKGAKATFYVIGRSAFLNPALLSRIYAEGHDLGNHTFTHGNLFASGPGRVAAELNATQRVFEAQLGIRSSLFRPPYASHGYSYLEETERLGENSGNLGYVIGGFDVDTFDYFSTAEMIASRIVQGVKAGGRIILLHDSGGNRESTVAALPIILDQLQAEGFDFVTTHEFVGMARGALMPVQDVADVTETSEAGFRLMFTRTVTWIGHTIPLVAIVTTILGVLRLTAIIIAAMFQRRKVAKSKSGAPFRGTAAVIVPAYNEEAVIAMTVRSLLNSTAGNRIEIIVVDDGSPDKTSDVVSRVFGHDERVRLFRIRNGGKSAALNYGIANTAADVVIAIDGDTVLMPDAIENLLKPFGDPAIGAVAGQVLVGNRRNLITRFQALEYITSQNLDRRAFELANAIGVVPGAIGAWRRAALLEAGGYSTDTLAEDADLTITLERLGWKVVAVSSAYALTEAPESLRSFLKQRFRWMFGMLQVAYKHSGAIFSRPSGVSLITIPNIVLFQFLFTLLAPIMDAMLLYTLLSYPLYYILGISELHQTEDLVLIAKYWVLFQSIDFIAVLIGVLLNGDRSAWRLLPLVILQRFTYRQLLYWVAIRALLASIKGTFVGWGKLVRTGSVATSTTSSLHPLGKQSS